MKMKQDFLLLEKIEKQDVKIIIPDSADKAGAKKDAEVFLVKEAGPGRTEFGKLIENSVKKHDRVLIVGYASMSVEGKVIHIGKERDVVAVL